MVGIYSLQIRLVVAEPADVWREKKGKELGKREEEEGGYW